MCGIAGWIGGEEAGRLDAVRGMLGRIAHRGPDSAGVFHDARAALGAVRLRVLDLAGGDQPLGDPTGRWWIVYNGEVYNYRELRAELSAAGRVFATATDTEVVLNTWIQWGPACLRRLNGGFAFAIYDKAEGTVALARDRFGKRPLFYARHGGDGWLFGSEMKAFFGAPGWRFAFDPDALASILSVWTPTGATTPFAGVRQLPEASWWRLRVAVDGGVSPETPEPVRYETLQLDPPEFAGGEDEAASTLRATLEESVRLRLRSDVEVATYLSGGLDSAIVTRLAVDQLGGGVRTFSVAFEAGEYDESAEQAAVAEALGTRHTSLRIGPRDIAEAFPEALWHAETPCFRTAFVPMYLLARRVRAEGIRVTLTGEGADEACWGYDLFRETRLRARWAELGDAERRAELANLYPYLAHFDGANARALTGLFQQFSAEKTPGLFSHELRFHNALFGLRLLAGGRQNLGPLAGQVAEAGDSFARLGPVARAQWLEFRTLLSGYLLSTQGDRMALGNGVENRCPFLDPAVVATAAGMNARFHAGPVEKALLRRAFAGRLPERVLGRRKHPYRAPEAAALLAAAPDYLDAVLSPGELAKVGLLDPVFCEAFTSKLRRLAPEAISPRENHAFIFLLSISLLHRQFVGGEDRPAERALSLQKVIAG
jgi:asparagine synthase (glutamine-hydrolysing)